MSEKELKKTKSVKYKAVDASLFKSSFNENMMFYAEFSEGKAVVCDKNHKQFKYLLDNNFITQE